MIVDGCDGTRLRGRRRSTRGRRDMFGLIPSRPLRRALELAPTSWRQPRACSDTQRLLDVNIYRRASLETGELATSLVELLDERVLMDRTCCSGA
jgi:hypothetical protein